MIISEASLKKGLNAYLAGPSNNHYLDIDLRRETIQMHIDARDSQNDQNNMQV